MGRVKKFYFKKRDITVFLYASGNVVYSFFSHILLGETLQKFVNFIGFLKESAPGGKRGMEGIGIDIYTL